MLHIHRRLWRHCKQRDGLRSQSPCSMHTTIHHGQLARWQPSFQRQGGSEPAGNRILATETPPLFTSTFVSHAHNQVANFTTIY